MGNRLNWDREGRLGRAFRHGSESRGPIDKDECPDLVPEWVSQYFKGDEPAAQDPYPEAVVRFLRLLCWFCPPRSTSLAVQQDQAAHCVDSLKECVVQRGQFSSEALRCLGDCYNVVQEFRQNGLLTRKETSEFDRYFSLIQEELTSRAPGSET